MSSRRSSFAGRPRLTGQCLTEVTPGRYPMSLSCSILIVDDDPGIRRSLRDVLEHKEYVVATASRGSEALAKCEQRAFDILLLDLKLPDISGLDLIARIEKILPRIDVLVVTGYATLDNAAPAVRPSTVAYMVKPVDLDRLLEIIGQVAKRKQLENRERAIASGDRARQEPVGIDV